VLGQAGHEVEVQQVELALAGALQHDHADDAVGAEQRHGELGHAVGQRLFVVRIDRHIRDQRRLRAANHAPDDPPVGGIDHLLGIVAAAKRAVGRVAVGGHDAQHALLAVENGQDAGLAAALAQRPVHRDIDHAGQVEGAVQLVVDALHGVQLLHAQGELLVGHVEQARVFDGDGGLPGERLEQVGVFLDEDAAVGLVDRLEHANHPAADHQRHGQDRARLESGVIERGVVARQVEMLALFRLGFLIAGLADVAIPARIARGIVDDDRRGALHGGPSQAAARRDARPDQVLPAAAHHHVKFEGAGFFVHQQQAARLGAQNLHRVLGDQTEQAVHVAHLGRELVRDLVDGAELARALLRLVEELELVDRARCQVGDIPEQVELVVVKGDVRLGRGGGHHAQHAPAGIGQQRHAHPRLELRVVQLRARVARQRVAREIIGAQRLARAHDLAHQVATHAPALAFQARDALVALVVEHVGQLVEVGVAQRDIEVGHIDHADRLRVDQLEQRVEIDREVERAAHLAEHVLHADAPLQVVDGLGALDRQRDLVAQALDEAQVFVQVGRGVAPRADDHEAVQHPLAAQAHDHRRAEHRQPRAVADHVQRQRLAFFQVEQAGALAEVMHQPAFRRERDVGEWLAGGRIGLGPVIVGHVIAHEDDHVRGRQRVFQGARDQGRHIAHRGGVRHIARELLDRGLVGAARAEIYGVDHTLQRGPDRVEYQRHHEDRGDDQRRAERGVARAAPDQHRDAGHDQPVAQREQADQRCVQHALRDHTIGIHQPELGRRVNRAQREENRQHLVEHDQVVQRFARRQLPAKRDQQRDRQRQQPDQDHRALVADDG